MSLELQADCSNCAALCCIAFTFDKRASFGIDKEAEEPCPNLDSCGGCKIYDTREEKGFTGCLAYECHGAGQRVTQEMFSGRSWLEDDSLIKPMCEAMSVMRRLHEVLAMLNAAKRLPLDESDRTKIDALVARGDFDSKDVAFEDLYFRTMDLETESHALLATFRRYASALTA